MIGLMACGFAAMLAAPAIAGRSYGGNCVLYARNVTGLNLDGNAGMWWSHADGRYQRGHAPAVGAVLVFRPSGHMRAGHVAVVSRVVNRREILIDHANWVRGRIVTGMSAIDVSANNDWTNVRVLEPLRAPTAARTRPSASFTPTRSTPPAKTGC